MQGAAAAAVAAAGGWNAAASSYPQLDHYNLYRSGFDTLMTPYNYLGAGSINSAGGGNGTGSGVSAWQLQSNGAQANGEQNSGLNRQTLFSQQ